MNDEQDDDQLESPILLSAVLGKAFEHYKKEFQFFISVSLIYALLSEGGNYLIGKFHMPAEEELFAKSIVNIVIAGWASIVIIYSAHCLANNKRVIPLFALVVARNCYSRYLSVYLAMLCVVIAGFFLFIVPGLYFMTLFLFVDILVVVENATFRQAFGRSAMMTRPYFWKIFAYLMIVVSVSLLPELIYQVGLTYYPHAAPALQKVSAVIILPFLLIAQVELFTKIKSRTKLDLISLEDEIDSTLRDD